MQQDSWIINLTPQRSNASLRLILFPHAGAASTIYNRWPLDITPNSDVWAVTLPGRGTRVKEPLCNSMAEIVSIIVRYLKPIIIGKRYVLYGHSMGTFIAFEVARQLRREGFPQPHHLVFSGAAAPQNKDELWKGRKIRDYTDAQLVDLLKQYDGIPPVLLNSQKYLSITLPPTRADMILCDEYEYRSEEPFSCPISYFGGEKDATPIVGKDKKLQLSWDTHTKNFSSVFLPGGHFFTSESWAPFSAMFNQILQVKPYTSYP